MSAQGPYTLGPLNPIEAKQLTDEMSALLQKYDAEMQVTSQIQLFKRVYANTQNGIVSPIQPNDIKDDKGEGEGGGFKAA